MLADARGRVVRWGPGPLGHLDEAELDGLVAETVAKYYAQVERGLNPPAPTGVLAFLKGPDGRRVERTVGPDEEPRVTASLAKLSEVLGDAVAALRRRGVRLRGARCWARRRGKRGRGRYTMSVDLRLRYGRYKALAELKWHETSLRPAKTRARAERRTLAKYARRGVWKGPHPRKGKSARAGLVGAVALARHAVYCRLWKVCGAGSRPSLRGFKRWQPQLGRASGHARAVAAAAPKRAGAHGARPSPAVDNKPCVEETTQRNTCF